MEAQILTIPSTSKRQPRIPISRSVSQPTSTQHTEFDSMLPTSTPKKQPRKQQLHQSQPQATEANGQAGIGAITPSRSRSDHHANIFSMAMGAQHQKGYPGHMISSNALLTPNSKQSNAELIQPNSSSPAKSKSQAYAGPTFHASPAASALPIPKLFARSTRAVDTISEARIELGLSSSSSSNAGDNSPTMAAALRASDQKIREASPLDVFFNADRAERARQQLGVLTPGSTQDDEDRRSTSISPLPQYRQCRRQSTDEVAGHDSITGFFPLELDALDAVGTTARPPMASAQGKGQRAESSPSILFNSTSRETIAKQKTLALKQFLLSAQSQSSKPSLSTPLSSTPHLSHANFSLPSSIPNVSSSGILHRVDSEDYKSSPSPSPYSKDSSPSPAPSTPNTSTGFAGTSYSNTSPYWSTPAYRNIATNSATRYPGHSASSQLRQQVSPSTTNETVERPSSGTTNTSPRVREALRRNDNDESWLRPTSESHSIPRSKASVNSIMEEQLRQILRLEPIIHESSLTR